MQIRFQSVHQLEDVSGVPVVVTMETQVGMLEHFFQVMEKLIRFFQIVSQMIHVARVMCDGVDVRGNSVKLNRVGSQMTVFGFVRVMQAEFLEQFTRLSLHLHGQGIDVLEGVRTGGRYGECCQSECGGQSCSCECHFPVSRFSIVNLWVVVFPCVVQA